jgi:hypothetical protein
MQVVRALADIAITYMLPNSGTTVIGKSTNSG